MLGKRKRLYRKNYFRMNANITKIALLEIFYEHLPNHLVIYLHLIALRYEYVWSRKSTGKGATQMLIWCYPTSSGWLNCHRDRFGKLTFRPLAFLSCLTLPASLERRTLQKRYTAILVLLEFLSLAFWLIAVLQVCISFGTLTFPMITVVTVVVN